MKEKIIFNEVVKRTNYNYEVKKDTKLKIKLLEIENKHNVLKIYEDDKEILSYSFAFGCAKIWLNRETYAVWDKEHNKDLSTTQISGFEADEYEKFVKIKNLLNEIKN